MTGEELKKAREAKSLTQSKLAELSGIPLGTIGRIEASGKDTIKKAIVVEALQTALGGNSGQNQNDRRIPIYDIEIDAGNVARLIDDHNTVPVVGHLQLNDSLNTSGLMGVRAKGDSMATFINGGDIMLIRKLESRSFIPPGHAYVVIGKELTVVKYIRQGSTHGHWVLRSHNEYYEDFEVEKSDVIHLFIVVKVLKELTY